MRLLATLAAYAAFSLGAGYCAVTLRFDVRACALAAFGLWLLSHLDDPPPPVVRLPRNRRA